MIRMLAAAIAAALITAPAKASVALTSFPMGACVAAQISIVPAADADQWLKEVDPESEKYKRVQEIRESMSRLQGLMNMPLMTVAVSWERKAGKPPEMVYDVFRAYELSTGYPALDQFRSVGHQVRHFNVDQLRRMQPQAEAQVSPLMGAGVPAEVVERIRKVSLEALEKGESPMDRLQALSYDLRMEALVRFSFKLIAINGPTAVWRTPTAWHVGPLAECQKMESERAPLASIGVIP